MRVETLGGGIETGEKKFSYIGNDYTRYHVDTTNLSTIYNVESICQRGVHFLYGCEVHRHDTRLVYRSVLHV